MVVESEEHLKWCRVRDSSGPGLSVCLVGSMSWVSFVTTFDVYFFLQTGPRHHVRYQERDLCRGWFQVSVTRLVHQTVNCYLVDLQFRVGTNPVCNPKSNVSRVPETFGSLFLGNRHLQSLWLFDWLRRIGSIRSLGGPMW